MKVKKKFTYQGIELRIVDREEPYMNGGETMTLRCVLAPNGGSIPVKIERGDTLKKIEEKTVLALDNFKKLGANIEDELTKIQQQNH